MTDDAIAQTVAPPATGMRAFASLRHRDFALIWTAAIISNTGSWMQSVTVPYVIYTITGSTTWLGVSAFVTIGPGVLVGPLSGAIADRFSRRGVLIVTQTAQMIVAFALWGLWTAGRATPTGILAILLVGGFASGINITSWQSFVPSLVPREHLLSAVRVNSMQFTAARAVGPAIAGVVLARFGPSTAFMVNAVTFVLVIAALFAVRPRPNPIAPAGSSFVRQFRDGVAYVRQRRALVLCIATISVVSFLPSALVQLAPAFAHQQFRVGKAGYGLLVAAYGAGSIVGSTSVAIWGGRFPRSRAAVLGLLLSTAGVLLLAASGRFGVGLFALFVMGAAYVMVAISLNTSIQARVAEAYRGRVVSLFLMSLMAGLPLGALVLGRVADAAGLRVTVAGSGIVLGVYALIAIVHFDRLRPIDEDADEASAVAA